MIYRARLRLAALMMLAAPLVAGQAVAASFDIKSKSTLAGDLNRTLIVDRVHGTVDASPGGDSGVDPRCPVPRDSAVYGGLSVAVYCARPGDTIQIEPGQYSVGHHKGRPWTPYGILFDKRLTIIGAGASRTIIYGEYGLEVEVYSYVEFSGISFMQTGIGNYGGTVVVADCVFSGVTDATFGPAISNSGLMWVIRSVISGNSFNTIIDNRGRLTIFQSTIAGNTAYGNGVITNDDDATLKIAKSAITSNDGSTNIYNAPSGRVIVRQTIGADGCIGCP